VAPLAALFCSTVRPTAPWLNSIEMHLPAEWRFALKSRADFEPLEHEGLLMADNGLSASRRELWVSGRSTQLRWKPQTDLNPTLGPVLAKVGSSVPVGVRISQGKVNDFTQKCTYREHDTETIFGTLAEADISYIHRTEHKA
jgi:hypothetical protein